MYQCGQDEERDQRTQQEPAVGGGIPLRRLARTWSIVALWLKRGMTFYHILVGLGILLVVPIAHDAVHLGFAMCLAFLLYPSSRRTNKLTVLDLLLAVGAVAMAAYTFYMQQYQSEAWVYRAGETTTLELLLGIVAIVTIMEATRRVLGWPLVIISLASLIYAHVSGHLPGFLGTTGFSIERLINYTYVTGNGIWGIPLSVSARDVFLFLLFATCFAASGVGELLVKVAMGLCGGVAGGPAKVSIIASAFFGTISGSAIANVLTTGSFTIPMMKRIGYAPHFAGAVEAVASTGGMFTPPVMGVAAFIMAQYLGIGYGDILVAAAIPAFLYYLALYFAIDAEARRHGLRGLPREELPSPGPIIKSGWYIFTPLALLIYLLVWYGLPPALSGLYSAAAVVAVYILANLAKKKQIDWKLLIKPLEETATISIDIAVTTAVVGITVGMIELTGLGIRLSQGLIALSGGHLPVLLLLTMGASLLLGMGLPPGPCYITLAILVAPTLVEMGVPKLAAHYFVFMFGIMSMITPPVALSSYVAASVAGANMFTTGWTAVKIALPSFIVPFMFVYAPSLLAQGSAAEVLSALLPAMLGVWAFSSGVFGWWRGRVGWVERALLVTAGILLIHVGWVTDLVGLVMIAAAWIISRSRHERDAVVAGGKARHVYDHGRENHGQSSGN